MRNVYASTTASLFLSVCLTIAPAAEPQKDSTSWPGFRPDGSLLLPNQWSLRPAGRQIPLGDFPLSIAVHRGSRYAAVLHCGHGTQEVAIVNLRTNGIASRAGLDEAFYGVEFSRDGSK